MKYEIQQLLRDSLTKAELLEILEQYDDDTKITFSCDYGDYHHTQQVLAVGRVREDVETAESFSESGYSQSRVEVRDEGACDEERFDDDDDDEEEEEREEREELRKHKVVVLVS